MRAGDLAAMAAAAASSIVLASTLVTTITGDQGLGGIRGTAAAPSVTVRITDVVDGATLRAETPAGRDLGRVRLLGIDAPETAHDGDPAECYANEATELLAGLIPPGTSVTLAADPQQPDRDVYGRLLRYVDHRGEDLSEALLDAGAARLYDSDPQLRRASSTGGPPRTRMTRNTACGARADPLPDQARCRIKRAQRSIVGT